MTRHRRRWAPVPVSNYESNERARDAIFAGLRTHLLRPETPAKVVVDLLQRHFLGSPAFTGSSLTQSERAVLIEVLHKVLDEWSQWERAASSDYVSPNSVILFFARHRILGPPDWAFCLNSLSWTAFEASFRHPTDHLDQSLQMQSDTFLLLRQLLRAWRLFFYCHSRESYDLSEVRYSDHPGLWPLLQHRSLPTALRDHTSNFSLRLLSFAPRWTSDEESWADQQLVCASMMTIAALSQIVENSTATSILLPPAVIDWEMSRIGAPKSSGSKIETSDPGSSLKGSSEPGEAPFVLSSDELSLLFIIGQALNSRSINLTLLRVSLAKAVPVNQIGQITSIFSQFRSRVPDLLGQTRFDNESVLNHLTPGLAAHHAPAPLLNEPVGRQSPLDLLLQKVEASQTTSELESLRQVHSSLSERNPRLKLGSFPIAIYKKYLRIGTSNQEREMWHASPLIHSLRHLWELRLDFYFRQSSITAFEGVWADMIAAGHRISAADCSKKLQLYFNCGLFRQARERFDTFLRLSGRHQTDDLSAVRPLLVNVETFNLMIENLLEINQESYALELSRYLEVQPDIQPNETTYDLFFTHWIRSGNRKRAIRHLRMKAAMSSSVGFAPYFKVIQLRLQEWPRSAPWADTHLVMEVFDSILGERYFKSKILRRISLLSHEYGKSVMKLSPALESETLTGEIENGIADDLVERVPMRLGISPSTAIERLRSDFVSLMSAIAKEYPNPKRARIMLISWTYCLLQGLPVLQEVEDHLRRELSQLPFRQQLRLLGGDVYQRSSCAGYGNFAYVRTLFGPEFAAQRLEGLGLSRYSHLIRILPWHGFSSYDDRLLLEIGVTSARARNLFLDDMRNLYYELETYRAEEQKLSLKRIASKEGVWYLSDAVVDNSGSLRNIPFEYWGPESKRRAVQKFKLATAVPRLLGGVEALRRFKQRMLLRGRRSLTRSGKGLVTRPLQEQLFHGRRARPMRSSYRRKVVLLRRRRDVTKAGRGRHRSAASKMERRSLADVVAKADEHLTIPAGPPVDKSIAIPVADFPSMTDVDERATVAPAIPAWPLVDDSIAIPQPSSRLTIIPDTEKTVSDDQRELYNRRSSSDSKPKPKNATIRVRRLMSSPSQTIRLVRVRWGSS